MLQIAKCAYHCEQTPVVQFVCDPGWSWGCVWRGCSSGPGGRCLVVWWRTPARQDECLSPLHWAHSWWFLSLSPPTPEATRGKVEGKDRKIITYKTMFRWTCPVLWVYIVAPHLQTLVDCHNRRLIVDRIDIDVHGAGQAVLPDFCLVGHDGEVVSLCVAAIVDVRDVLTFHLRTEARWRRYQHDTHPIMVSETTGDSLSLSGLMMTQWN